MKKLLGVLICIMLLCAGCGGNNDSKGIKWGFENNKSSDELPPDYCAYKSENTEFTINDVTLTFSYGGLFLRISIMSYKMEEIFHISDYISWIKIQIHIL